MTAVCVLSDRLDELTADKDAVPKAERYLCIIIAQLLLFNLNSLLQSL